MTGLSAKDLSLHVASGRAIVDRVSLDVAPGERLAIVGPNGAGKTSLLRLLFGRLRPTGGRVWVDGRPLDDMPLHERALKIAVLTQSDHPDLRLSLSDYVGLGRLPHYRRQGERQHRAVIADALERVGLSMVSHRKLEHLSGGERQRGAIARAIAQEPEVLILDEPTNHLDPRARADMLDLARGLGITVVAVLHDLGLVSGFADRVAVLNAGRLVAHAPAALALARPIVRAVFNMDCFPATNPATGRIMLVFDKPVA